MTTWRLMDGADGRPGVGSSGTQPPANGTSYSGNYVAGLNFCVTEGVWLEGYWWWVPAGTDPGMTAAQEFALWQVTGNDAGEYVAGSKVTSGTLTAGEWNYVALPAPLALAQNMPYQVNTGMAIASGHGFPSTTGQFGSGDPYAAGITNGPLTAYSSLTGSSEIPGGWLPQMPYSTPGGTDPSVYMAQTNDQDDLLWIDLQVTDQAPAGATYRAFPNFPAAISGNIPQTSVNYTLGQQFSLTERCQLMKLWHYSPPSVTILPTRTGVWDVELESEVAGTDSQSPSWLLPGGGAAAAGDGWMYVDYSGANVILQAGRQYKASRFSAPTSTAWFTTTVGYWSTGDGSSGLTQGPLVFPDNASGTPGQDSYLQSSTWGYPVTSANGENTWGDIEVLPVTASPSGLLMAAGII